MSKTGRVHDIMTCRTALGGKLDASGDMRGVVAGLHTAFDFEYRAHVAIHDAGQSSLPALEPLYNDACHIQCQSTLPRPQNALSTPYLYWNRNTRLEIN